LASPLPGLPLYPALHAFVGAITVIGLGRFGYLALSLQRGALHTPEPIGFAAFVILAELLPVKVPRRADELTVSTTFAFALLITSGLPEAVVAQTAALVIADVLRPRRSRAVTSTSRRARSRWRPPHRRREAHGRRVALQRDRHRRLRRRRAGLLPRQQHPRRHGLGAR
jgi:hypothetical protein